MRQRGTHGLAGHLGVVVGLEIDPAVGIGSKECRQAQGRINRNAALAMDDFIDTAGRNANRLRQCVLADVQRPEPLFQQDFAGVGGRLSAGISIITSDKPEKSIVSISSIAMLMRYLFQG